MCPSCSTSIFQVKKMKVQTSNFVCLTLCTVKLITSQKRPTASSSQPRPLDITIISFTLSPDLTTDTMATKLRTFRIPSTTFSCIPKSLPRSRPYHSTTHPPPPSPRTPLERAILSAAYKHVPSTGFTAQTLAKGAEEVGAVPASGNLFVRGEWELVGWHLEVRRRSLENCVAELRGEMEGRGGNGKGEGRRIGTGELVRELCWRRLLGNAEVGVVGRLQEVCFLSFSLSLSFLSYTVMLELDL